MKDLNEENNALHQTPAYISAYWKKQRPPQSAPLKQQAASFTYRALRRLTWGDNRLGRVSASPSPAPPAKGSLHPPLWKRHHLGYATRRAPSPTFSESLSRPSVLPPSRDRQFPEQERPAAAFSGGSPLGQRGRLPRAPAAAGSLLTSRGRGRQPPPPPPSPRGLPAPKSRPQAARRRDPAAPERSGAFPPSGGLRRPGPRAGGPAAVLRATEAVPQRRRGRGWRTLHDTTAASHVALSLRGGCPFLYLPKVRCQQKNSFK